MGDNSIQLFGSKRIRTQWDAEKDTVTFNFEEQERSLSSKGYKYIKSLKEII